MDIKIDKIDSKIDALKPEFDKIDSKIETIKSELNTLNSKIRDISDQISQISLNSSTSTFSSPFVQQIKRYNLILNI